MVNKVTKDSPLLDKLLEKGLISSQQYSEVMAKKEAGNASVERILQEAQLVSEEELTRAKGEVLNVPYVDLHEAVINQQDLRFLPQNLAQNYQMIVFAIKDNQLQVGLVDPTNFQALEVVEYLARKNNYKVKYYIISRSGFVWASKKYESLKQEVGEVLGEAEEKFSQRRSVAKGIKLDKVEGDLEDIIKSAPVSKMVSVIIRHAVEGKASDIHIEPVGDGSRVRYRIDGILHTSLTLPEYVHSAIVTRIKVLSNLKIDETRIPQDGRIRLDINDRDVDFRVSTIPLVGKEKVVMRILESPDKAPTLEDLGFIGHYATILKRELKKPNGLFLVTGPTGSGKSTTLFATLDILNREEVNISTLEDPVEYFVPGVNQSQVHPEIGYTFASGLRSLLRQDPDIVMVGEIRDGETAELAIHAALTGHFVLSTLHTNDAPGAIPRFLDMGAESFLLGSTLNVIIAQRLIRKICDKCKEEIQIPPEAMAEVKAEVSKIKPEYRYDGIDLDNMKFYKGKGCHYCGDTGYKGRFAIAELIAINQTMREIITEEFDQEALEKELERQGFFPMKTDGFMKALLGITTVEEILRVTRQEEAKD
ncbi:MAG: GspE/PulE family protein [Candidatus Komeilibacteria bacterium]